MRTATGKERAKESTFFSWGPTRHNIIETQGSSSRQNPNGSADPQPLPFF